MEGLLKIIALKACFSKGLSEQLKTAFVQHNIIFFNKSLISNKRVFEPNWLAGFISAEGCFFVNIFKSKTKVGFTVVLRFKLTQHSRDEELMRSLIEYLGCGNVYKNKEAVDYIVTKFSDIYEKIIPFLKNTLSRVKNLKIFVISVKLQR